MWSFGFGMWLTTDQNGLVAWTRGLWLVSLNQSQTGFLEKLRVFILEIYGSDIVYGSEVYTYYISVLREENDSYVWFFYHGFYWIQFKW